MIIFVRGWFTGETSKEIATQKINISDLNAGLYMVKAGTKIIKLIKKLN